MSSSDYPRVRKNGSVVQAPATPDTRVKRSEKDPLASKSDFTKDSAPQAPNIRPKGSESVLAGNANRWTSKLGKNDGPEATYASLKGLYQRDPDAADREIAGLIQKVLRTVV